MQKQKEMKQRGLAKNVMALVLYYIYGGLFLVNLIIFGQKR